MPPAMWIVSVLGGYVNCLYPRFLALVLQVKSGVPHNNANPRDQVESKEVAMKDIDGYTRRAIAAHKNGWEAINMWVAAIVLARLTDVETEKMNTYAAIWLASRILYNPAYILIKNHTASFVRTALFAVAMSCSFSLMYAAIQKAESVDMA